MGLEYLESYSSCRHCIVYQPRRTNTTRHASDLCTLRIRHWGLGWSRQIIINPIALFTLVTIRLRLLYSYNYFKKIQKLNYYMSLVQTPFDTKNYTTSTSSTEQLFVDTPAQLTFSNRTTTGYRIPDCTRNRWMNSSTTIKRLTNPLVVKHIPGLNNDFHMDIMYGGRESG